jgi:hypothetical protein
VDNARSRQLAANYRKSGRSHWWRKPRATRICGLAEIRPRWSSHFSRNIRALYTSLRSILDTSTKATFSINFRNSAVLSGRRSEKIKKSASAQWSALWKNHFPVLCNEILTRRRLHRREKILELKGALRSALLDVPAPSLVSLCKTLNTPEHALEKMCPRECASIRARYRHAREDASVRRKEQLRQEVRKITQKLHGEGNYPTIKQVRSLLSQRNHWAEVSAAVATVRKEFRVTMQTSGRRDPE